MGDSYKPSQDYETLTQVYKKALDTKLSPEDVADLTIYGKCQVVHSLVEALRKKLPQAKHGTARHTRESLLLIANSFEPSDYLLGEQYRKRNIFLRVMQHNENQGVLDTIRRWDTAPQEERNQAIELSCKLHQKIYTTGISDCLPVEHVFESRPRFLDKVILGGFKGDIDKKRGFISHNTDFYTDPYTAFETAHHETTHAVQFCLISAFHYNQIRHDHKLYEDARIFHAIEVNRAMIDFSVLKSTDNKAYSNQIHEVLAEDEGRLIAHGLINLARE